MKTSDPNFGGYMLEVRHDAGILCMYAEKENIRRELALEIDKNKIRTKRKCGIEHLESADRTLLIYALVNHDLLRRLTLLFYSSEYPLEEYNNAVIKAEDWSPSEQPPEGKAFQIRKEARKICLSHEREEIEKEFELYEESVSGLSAYSNKKRLVRPGMEQDSLFTADQDMLIYCLINYEKIRRLAPLVLDSWQNFDGSLAKIEDWIPESKN